MERRPPLRRTLVVVPRSAFTVSWFHARFPGSLMSFRSRSRRSAWWAACSGDRVISARSPRTAAVLALSLLAVAFFVVVAGPRLHAQTPPPPTLARGEEFRTCFNTSVDDRINTPDPLLQPGSAAPIRFDSPLSILRTGVDCAHDFAVDVIRPIGWTLLTGLTLIIVVWTGIMIMFAGRFDLAQILNLILLIGFAIMVMNGFEPTGHVWGDISFPQFIFGQGEFIGGAMVEATFTNFANRVQEFFQALTAGTSGSGESGPSLWAIGLGIAAGGLVLATGGVALLPIMGALAVGGGTIAAVSGGVGPLNSLMAGLESILIVLVVLAGVVPAVVLFCSYLWAYVGFMVAIILGPLFVPWMLVPQLDWLFWSWIKSIVKMAVHLMVAATLFTICAEFAAIPITRLTVRMIETNALASAGEDSSWGFQGFTALFNSLITYIPLVVLMFLMCGKTGEMTGMLTEGQGMPAAGMSGLAARAGRTGIGQSMGGAAMRGLGGAAGLAAGGVAAAAGAVGKVFSGK